MRVAFDRHVAHRGAWLRERVRHAGHEAVDRGQASVGTPRKGCAVRRCRLGVTATGLLLSGGLTVPGLAGPAAADDQLQLSGVQLSPDDRVLTAVVTVPLLLSTRQLPAAAFTASQDGRPLPLSAMRVVESPSELVVVLDTSVPVPQLAAEQSAAADLLRALPPDLPTTVLPGGDRTTARSAIGDVASLAPRRAALLDGLPDTPSVRRLVVVLAACPAVDAERRTVGGGQTQVSVLATEAGCGAAAGRLAGPEPGVVRLGLDTPGLFAAADQVSRLLLGQYALRTEPGVGPGPVQLTVHDGATSAALTFAPASSAPGPAVSVRRRGPLVVAVVLLVLALTGLALEGAARLRRAT